MLQTSNNDRSHVAFTAANAGAVDPTAALKVTTVAGATSAAPGIARLQRFAPRAVTYPTKEGGRGGITPA